MESAIDLTFRRLGTDLATVTVAHAKDEPETSDLSWSWQALSLDIFERVADGQHISDRMLGMTRRPREGPAELNPTDEKPREISSTNSVTSYHDRVEP